jgi:hypothetical protein
LLAIAGAIPATLEAVTIKDDAFTLNIGMDVQARQEFWNAKNTTGGDYDGLLGRDGKSDVSFQERRARLFVYGSYEEVWKYNLSYLDDRADNVGYSATGTRNVALFKAFLERDFIDGDAKHTLHAGVDYPFFNLAIQSDPRWLFPNQRATGTLLGVRGSGARYMYSDPMFTFGADVMESLDPGKPGANATHSDGLFYCSRLEVSCLGGKKPGYMESYAGKEGHSLILAADIGYDSDDYQIADHKIKALCYGIEALYHLNGLSALAEYRALRTENDSLLGAGDAKINSRIWLIQAGYAMPVGSTFVEPALRFTKIDYDTATTETVNYNGTVGGLPPALTGAPTGTDSENGLSGKQLDVGVNWYLSGHNIQIQLAYSYWKAEAGDAKANIVRLQEQVAF